MRVPLDECIDEGLRHAITGHDCETCRYAGLKGLTNGRLLAAAEQAGFEVLITVDRNLPYQQRLRDREIGLIILQGRTTNLDDLLALIPDVLTILAALKPGDVVRVRVTQFDEMFGLELIDRQVGRASDGKRQAVESRHNQHAPGHAWN